MRYKKIRNFIKNSVFRFSLLRSLFVLMYKLGGKKPWSIGYSVYKFSQIKNVIANYLDMFSQGALSQSYGFGLDERIVEYPWFFSRLKPEVLTILDAGSSLNHADILSASLLKNRKLYISTLAFENSPPVDNTPIYAFEDIRDMGYKNEFFDAVVCISTLEHVGMDNAFIYTSDETKKEDDQYAFLAAIDEFKRALKTGGTLYLTMPYGKYQNHKWFQIFDAKMVEKLKEQFSPSKVSEVYFRYSNGQWDYSSAQACQDGYYFDIHHEKECRQDHLAASESVVCLELTK